MLNTNLSSRPFYNVRAVQAAIWLAAILVLAISAFNAVRIVRLTLAQQTLGASAADAEQEAERLRSEAAVVRGQINPRELDVVTGAAREANGIIDRRAFSWTALFAQFEQTLPPDVRITAVQPQLERDGTFRVAVAIEARRAEDLDAFLEALETEGGFRDVLPIEEARTDDGLLEATIEGIYVPPEAP
jgi:hypothetical protein